ncbi:MAG: hypothetical protein AB7V27_14010 [Candidatus Binatia bacterium]
MAWIETVDEADATGELAEFYGKYVDGGLLPGKVDLIWKVHSLHLEGMKAHEAVYFAVMRGTPTFTAGEREMVATVVSVINDCHY